MKSPLQLEVHRAVLALVAALGLMALPTPAQAGTEALAPVGRIVAHAGLGYGKADTRGGSDQSMGFSFEAAWLFELAESGLRLGPRAEIAGYSTFHSDGQISYGTRSYSGGLQAEFDTEPAPSELLGTDYHLGTYLFVAGGGLEVTRYDKRTSNEIKIATTDPSVTVGGGLNCYMGEGLYGVVGLSIAYGRGLGNAKSDNVRVLGQVGFAFD
ncbi:MAG: hypothetical protein KDH09_02885 [Chrysiogenetes bacterium]|nr:hypothetical protein [Chrysiogenetes bacterium]